MLPKPRRPCNASTLDSIALPEPPPRIIPFSIPFTFIPFIFIPFILIPFRLIPFILIPFILIPFILIPFILIPFILIPFILIPFILIPFILIPFILIPLKPLIPFKSGFSLLMKGKGFVVPIGVGSAPLLDIESSSNG